MREVVLFVNTFTDMDVFLVVIRHRKENKFVRSHA